ncbi:PDZ domain-containing protein [Neobacillus notoginsengisoli]|uniref:endopeptidase La n=1 Tax=Neobacillus notoginsengisoli TaxID=1578198 RepID=A0A417YQJ6_9BACI|nr:SepM family pheromone-processing serine protease [Neobacillus notoginsengisoli]RHW36519.1 PDZ domain-containing protein [Neobacillus notoginsengisoli]
MRNKNSRIPYILAALLFMASIFYSLPYYVSKPGLAKELEPIITVENGYEEEGSFMLTTVRMGRANIYTYLLAKFGKYQEIYSVDEVLGKGESEKEYNTKQMHMMEGSKSSAIEAAYKKAGIPVEYRYKGVYIMGIAPGMPAEGKLETGDMLLKADGKRLQSRDQLLNYLNSKTAGNEVTLTFSRKGKEKNVSLQLESFKDDPNKAGIGIYLVDDIDIIVKPKVKVKTDEIGGPSAGLMFALEIYNQLTEDDLTKGYKIAGTGTLSEGIVGPIGGIEQKIVAADKAGAEIFFAPNEEGAKDSNYRAALKTGKDIKTKMKIVPVDSFDEAVDYLEKLKPKKRKR